MNRKLTRPSSIFLLIIFLFETIAPSVTWALTGGPSQPEVQSFEPVGTTQMVDLFSGDFNYNIPIMDIDGYPINLAYHSGITMDQEASWVGLGWNLNPGVINRNMRGVPDDFNGDEIKKELRHKTDETFGGNIGAGYEFGGFEFLKTKANFDISANLGITYNNYRGLGFEFGITPSFSAGEKMKGKLSLGLINSSTDGASVRPKLGLEFSSKYINSGLGGSYDINSREGLKSRNITTKVGYKNVTEGTGSSHISYNTATYVPSITMPMKNTNATLSIKMGPTYFLSHSSLNIGGYYASQWIADEKINRKSYGVQYLQNSIGDENIVDFNREKDGVFTSDNPVIGIPQLTQDLYSYSGQGIGGMFKSYRNDIPIVSDPSSQNDPSVGGSIGSELGVGNFTKYGLDLTFNYSRSHTRRWKDKSGEDIFQKNGINLTSSIHHPLYEFSYFKNIGEKTQIDDLFNPYTKLNENFSLKTKFYPDVLTDRRGDFIRNKRDKRDTYIRKLSNEESDFCLNKKIYFKTTSGPNAISYPIERLNEVRKAGHNSEITVTKPDGSKYVYGIAAYNTIQKEYTFTNAFDVEDVNHSFPNIYCKTGEVEYDPYFTKFRGIDQHKEVIETPAYAHSYLLTDILSSDYQDINGDGPSVDDIGTYTKINYFKTNNLYQWRVPFSNKRANFNERLKSDKYDDNSNFIYGQKEIWHVHSIEGKNHIAYFYISSRSDGFGVASDEGGLGTNSKSYKLDSVVLYSRFDQIHPIKTAVFEYNYYLCPNVPNNQNTSAAATNGTIVENSGKLTLKKVYFKYGSSNKGKYNSYKFEYREGETAYNNPYHLKGYDSWGNYKPFEQILVEGAQFSYDCNSSGVLLAQEFPYVEQNKALADCYTSQWSLSKITLPSGGAIEVAYESDDYAYVQDRKAMQMYRLLGFGTSPSSTISNNLYSQGADVNNNYIFIEVPLTTNIPDLAKDISEMYYNVLVDIDNKSHYEYIRGYAKLQGVGLKSIASTSKIAWVKIETVDIKKDKADQVNPISSAGFNFARLNLPQLINPDANLIKSGGSGLLAFSKTVRGYLPQMTIEIANMIRGQNFSLISRDFCMNTNPAKSWIRLNNTNGFKLGGGVRVKKITSSDDFANMEGSSNINRTNKFTQEFDYTIDEGKDLNGNPIIISSGVASYEPQAGGDENPFRELGNTYEKGKTYVPDEQYFTEKPYGESFFPSANVGYSRVTVKSGNDTYLENTISRNGTGKVVNEFYTAKDFPTIVPNINLDVDNPEDDLIWALLYIDLKKNLRMAQSHRIELNDMHGKPKATWNFNQKNINSTSIENASSGVKYEYYEANKEGKRQLENKVKIVSKDGTIKEAIVGVDAEVVIDSRQYQSFTFSGGLNINLDVFFASIAPILVLTGFPNYNSEETNFKSASSMKVVNKYGILKRIIAYEEGASLTTENTVFDGETGAVLVSKTQNEFEDYIYNTTYPAHWVYEGMGQAYKNQGATMNIINTTNNGIKVVYNGINQNPELFLYHGDLIKLGNNLEKYWIYNSGGIWKVMDENGLFVTNISTINTTSIKVMESGRKNMQSMPIANYIQLDNPATSNSLNNSTNVLNSTVTEFDSLGKKQNCFKPITNSSCLSSESNMLMEYFFKKIIERKILNLDTTGFSHNGYFDTTFSTNNDLFSNSKYKEIYDKAYPNTSLYPVRIFLSYTGNSSSTYQFKFGYELAEINYTKGCKNYKTFLNTRGVTFALNHNNNPSHTCEGSNYSLNNCDYQIDSNLIGKTEIIIDFYNQFGCDCSPQFYSGGGSGGDCNRYNFNTETGICFDGYLQYYASDQGLGLNSTNLLPYPYNTFAQNCYRPVLVRTKRNPYETYTTRNAIIYYNSKYLETDLCNSMPTTENINPFKNGIQNNWKIKRNWVYIDKRTPEYGATNIRKDGTFKSFDNFWSLNLTSNKFNKNVTSKWQYTKEITKYNSNGAELESKNALGIYNASIFGFNNTLPIAVANNSKYNQILNLNFEKEQSLNNYDEKYKVSCPAVHQMFDLQTSLIDTNNFHTGFSSYKVIDTNYLVSTYANDKLIGLIGNGSSLNGYTTKSNDYIGVFEPSFGKSIISCWVKVGNTTSPNYLKTGLLIELKPKNDIYPIRRYNFKPSGNVIDGWQKIEGVFNINDFSIGNGYQDEKIIVMLYSGSNQTAYFDDLRIMPFNAAMNTYVYDPISLKLTAELDDNNYATFYEYDNEGNLIRIKKETEKGIVTIKEARNSFRKSN